jgi:hypothetical protein
MAHDQLVNSFIALQSGVWIILVLSVMHPDQRGSFL